MPARPPRFTQSEIQAIDRLIGASMFQPNLVARLLDHDNALAHEYRVPDRAWGRLTEISAGTLREFCTVLHTLQEGMP